MVRTKEIIACIVALIFLVLAATSVYANDTNINSVYDLLNNTGANNTAAPANTNNSYQQITVTNNTAAVNNTNTNNAVNVANTTNTVANTTVPYTGINNTSILVIIGICGISAIYAYKKIRDYNIK